MGFRFVVIDQQSRAGPRKASGSTGSTAFRLGPPTRPAAAPTMPQRKRWALRGRIAQAAASWAKLWPHAPPVTTARPRLGGGLWPAAVVLCRSTSEMRTSPAQSSRTGPRRRRWRSRGGWPIRASPRGSCRRGSSSSPAGPSPNELPRVHRLAPLFDSSSVQHVSRRRFTFALAPSRSASACR